MIKRQTLIYEIERLIEDKDFEKVSDCLNDYINQIEEVFCKIADTLKDINIDTLDIVSDIQQIAEKAADDLY